MKISRREFTTLLGAGFVVANTSEASFLSTDQREANSEAEVHKPVPVSNETLPPHSDVRYLPLILDY